MTRDELQDILEQAQQADRYTDLDRCESLAMILLNDEHTSGVGSDERIRLQLHAYELLATVTAVRGEFQSANTYSDKGIAIAEMTNNTEHRIRLLVRKAWNYRQVQNYPEAEKIITVILLLSREIGFTWGEARALSLQGYMLFNTGFIPEAHELHERAIALFQEIGDEYWLADEYATMAFNYASIGKLDAAFESAGKALALAEPRNFRRVIAATKGALGNAYGDLGDYPMALYYLRGALEIHEAATKSPLNISSTLDDIGRLYTLMGEYHQGIEYFLKALAMSVAEQHQENTSVIIMNIANNYLELGDYELSLEYSQRSLQMTIKGGNKKNEAINICNIGIAYSRRASPCYNPALAEEYLLRAIAILEKLDFKNILYQVYQEVSNFYVDHEQWEDAFRYKTLYHAVKDEVMSQHAQKKAQAMETERKYSVERARMQEREAILNNILPEEITVRLINGENPIADYFDSVSVMFMDIVDFTHLASTVTAQQLVHLLNAIFKAADGVMREYGLEKIKTIGDAYMAVAGAPIPQADHARRAAHAALQLLDVMHNLVVTFPDNYGDTSWMESIPEINVRIGLHCGPVAAGVVGENKFLYDLWGDAVNTASRMESHGEAGKIHVSEEFKHAVETQNIASLQFIERAEIDIKGKGIMKTYFLEKL